MNWEMESISLDLGYNNSNVEVVSTSEVAFQVPVITQQNQPDRSPDSSLLSNFDTSEFDLSLFPKNQIPDDTSSFSYEVNSKEMNNEEINTPEIPTFTNLKPVFPMNESTRSKIEISMNQDDKFCIVSSYILHRTLKPIIIDESSPFVLNTYLNQILEKLS